MKPYALILAMVGSLSSASAGEPLPLLPDRPFKAVILPAEAVRGSRSLTNYFGDFWTPSSDEVSHAEKRISEFIAADAAKAFPGEFAQKTAAKIHEHPEMFIRQYLGATKAGERIIICNALPTDTPPDSLQRWREKYVRVADYAGSWEIHYSPSKDKIVWFFIDQGY